MIPFILLLLTLYSPQNTSELVFITNERDGTISIVDAARDTVIGQITVGGRPRGIRVSPDQRTLFVAVSRPSALPVAKSAEYDFVVAVDVRTHKIIRRYSVGSDPEQLDISPDGRTLYVANEDAGTASIVDVKSGKITTALTVGPEAEGVRSTKDGRWVYVTSEAGNSISVINAKKQQLEKVLYVGARPRAIAFCELHRKAFVTNERTGDVSVVDLRSHDVSAVIALPKGSLPMDAAVSPDGKQVFVSVGRGNAVSVLSCTENTHLTSIPTGARTWGISLTQNGRKLYAANSLGNTVSVIDTRTHTVIRTISVGDGPWGVVTVHTRPLR